MTGHSLKDTRISLHQADILGGLGSLSGENGERLNTDGTDHVRSRYKEVSMPPLKVSTSQLYPTV